MPVYLAVSHEDFAVDNGVLYGRASGRIDKARGEVAEGEFRGGRIEDDEVGGGADRQRVGSREGGSAEAADS